MVNDLINTGSLVIFFNEQVMISNVPPSFGMASMTLFWHIFETNSSGAGVIPFADIVAVRKAVVIANMMINFGFMMVYKGNYILHPFGIILHKSAVRVS